jgi:protein ImuB
LAPDIHLIEHDPVREQQALRSLACRALRLTPSVGFAPPALPGKKPSAIDDAPLPAPGQAGLLLEVQASLRYFGGLPALLAQIENELELLGLHANCAVAPTPTAAWLLAEHHQCSPAQLMNDALSPHCQDINALPDRLASLPVSLLRHAKPHEAALTSIGARSIAELLDLPRAGLARRFGKQLLLEVDCALGSQAQPIGFFHAPEQFASQLQLLSNIEKVDELLVAAQHLLLELSGWLQARHAAVRVFDLIVQHEDPPATSMTVRLTDPSRNLDRLTGLLRERLNVLTLRAPVHTIELRCERIEPLAVASDELFASPTSTQENLGRLLERLQVRLGREQVQRLYLSEDHRPETAYQVHVIDKLDQLGKADPKTVGTTSPPATVMPPPLPESLFASDTGHLPRPLWLLREPQALRERNNRPWLNSALNMVAGPERIETGWWDSNLVQRDYFVAEDDAHTLYWIYRERQAAGGWFVHGRFG